MERRKVGGIEFRSVYVDLYRSRTVQWTWTPASGSEANAPDYHGMCELGM